MLSLVRAEIPAPILHADQRHYEILQRIPFSRHLNPINSHEARRAFRSGMHAPPFRYNPLTEADALLWELDRIRPPTDHPAGALLARILDGTALLIRALRDRTSEAFDALARHASWYPSPELLTLDFPEPPPDPELSDQPASVMIGELERALVVRGLSGWRVERAGWVG